MIQLEMKLLLKIKQFAAEKMVLCVFFVLFASVALAYNFIEVIVSLGKMSKTTVLAETVAAVPLRKGKPAKAVVLSAFMLNLIP